MLDFETTVGTIKYGYSNRYSRITAYNVPNIRTSDTDMMSETLLSKALAYTAGDNYAGAGDVGWYGLVSYTSAWYSLDTGMRVDYVPQYYDNQGTLNECRSERYTILHSAPSYPDISAPDLIKYVFLWLAKHCTYNSSLRTDGLVRNGIGDVLINHAAVCQGFASAMAFILDGYQGIEVRMIQGYEVSNLQFYPHCYNLIKYNGKAYFVDLTAAVHLHDSNPNVTDSELLRFCMTVHSDFNNKVLTDYVMLPNFLRLEFLRKYPIAETSYQW